MKDVLIFCGAVAAILVAVVMVVRGAEAGDPDTIHYPDLRMLVPAELLVEIDGGTGQRLLRLTGTPWNAGDGPLELRADNDPITEITNAYQRFYSHDAGGASYFVSETLVGTFEFHPPHNHWHFEDLAEYELRDVAPDGSIGDNVLVTSNKVSFCLRDSAIVDPFLEHAGPFAYTGCDEDDIQGISVGWGDVYSSFLPGQELDVTGFPDDMYWLILTADPTDILTETHESNNMAAVKIQLSGANVVVLSTDTDDDAIPDEIDNCVTVPNAGQENAVHAGTPEGDHCEDPDADLVMDSDDNCPDAANPGQENAVHAGTPEGDHCEDPDADLVMDIGDNCPDAANPGQENVVHSGTPEGDHCEDPDGDLVMDSDDNCPDTANSGQGDWNENGLGDACEEWDGDGIMDDVDNCPAWPNPDQSPLPWPVPANDPDCDSFTSNEEGFVGTDATDPCPDDPDDDAWPADMASVDGLGKHDGSVNILDIVHLTPPVFNSSPPNPNYAVRQDINGDGAINILDIVRLTPPVFNQSCA